MRKAEKKPGPGTNGPSAKMAQSATIGETSAKGRPEVEAREPALGADSQGDRNNRIVLQGARDDPDSLQRRTLLVLVAAQVMGGTGLFTGFAVTALLARELSGSAAFSGVPTALAVSASALAALPISRWMVRRGRRPGLALATPSPRLGRSS
jgi:hypothetical protein